MMWGMSDPAGRLLQLLSLLQTPRDWPGSELAQRLEVSPRTVRRDVERLRELGYPVQGTMGSIGGYRLVAGTAMPPLLLDDEEAVAIAVGLRASAGQAVEGIEDASVRALSKVVQVLPSRLRQRVRTLEAATVSLAMPGTAVDPDVLTALASAAAGHERVRFAYPGSDGATTERLVEPHQLVSAGRRWYLVAYDTGRQDWRTFRADRVRDLRPTGTRTRPRELPDADAAAYVERTMYDLPVYRALATVHAPAAEVARRGGDALGQVEPVDAGTCRVRTHADTLEWLTFRFMLLGCELVLHEPPELVEHARTVGARLTRAAG